MNIHLIAIGGSAMHNLALELHKKGYQVTGSDDEIFEPSKSRLEAAGLLPEKWGWYPERITSRLDAVILGMHAREDNPELQKHMNLEFRFTAIRSICTSKPKTNYGSSSAEVMEKRPQLR